LPKETVDSTQAHKREMSPEDALGVLGLQNFRHRQREVIDDILSSETDYVVTLPTGWGKSLLYLVPIISRGSPAVIVSPLVSLIYDQCAKINRSSHKMAYNISSSCSEEIPDEDTVFCDEQLSATGPLFIFCTPEKVATVSFRQKLERLHAARPFSYFVLDEAHLMEQGQSFRPDYMKLDYLRRTLAPDVPILCFSATCNDFLRGFLVRSLSLRNVRYVVERECRENMHLSVHYVSKKSKTCSCGSSRCSWKHGAQSLHEDARKIISTCKGGEGLVLTNNRKDCEELCADLQGLFPDKRIDMYHGQLEDEDRVCKQKDFVTGNIDCLVATFASFGTGVDMPLLNTIVIFGVPSALETLVQTIGRGGRQGQEFYVHVFVREQHVVKQRSIVQSEIEKGTLTVPFQRHLHSSFEAVCSLISCAGSRHCCLSQYMNGLMYEEGQALDVPYAHLQAFKRVNSKLPVRIRAKWDAMRKRWVLKPYAFHSSLVPYGAKEHKAAWRCNKCSVCIQVPQKTSK